MHDFPIPAKRRPIRLAVAHPEAPFSVGERVMAYYVRPSETSKYKSPTGWYPGHVWAILKSGEFEILYDAQDFKEIRELVFVRHMTEEELIKYGPIRPPSKKYPTWPR